MLLAKTSNRLPALLKSKLSTQFLPPICTIKFLKPPTIYPDLQMPEFPKPKIVPKVPQYPHGQKPPKMQRMINLMRYPEKVHNKLIHRQYGIQAVNGGRLKSAHFDVIRNALLKKLDFKRMFVTWRVDAPWQACTKRPIGFTLGGGKFNIHHYVTPVAPNRIIVEVAGKCTYDEVEYFLKVIADKMPFAARPVSQELLDEEMRIECENKEKNMNPYTYEYMIKNNMLGCRQYARRIDYFHFGKYI